VLDTLSDAGGMAVWRTENKFLVCSQWPLHTGPVSGSVLVIVKSCARPEFSRAGIFYVWFLGGYVLPEISPLARGPGTLLRARARPHD
jgi:hypothetical protein